MPPQANLTADVVVVPGEVDQHMRLIAGRWAIMLRGGVTGTLRGELRLEERAGSLGGTLWLENQERPVAVVATGTHASGESITFAGVSVTIGGTPPDAQAVLAIAENIDANLEAYDADQ